MQAYHKAEKARQLKKSKQAKTKQRQEKLARRNPARIEAQIAQLRGLEESGEIRPHERKTLSELGEELVKVKKAREALGVREDDRDRDRDRNRDRDGDRGGPRQRGRGVSGPGTRPGGAGRGSSEYKSSRGGEDSDSGESTASSVRDIPMPTGTPPPPPRQNYRQQQQPQRAPHSLPPKPPSPVAITTYEAKPVVRDLQKEAAVFVPAAVQRAIVRAAPAPPAPTLGDEESKVQQTPWAPPAELTTARLIMGAAGMVNAAPDVEGGLQMQVEVDDEEYERFRREMEMDMGNKEG